ncbi:MAG: ABC transporter permease [Rhizobiales bacterium]|nr:ABC transporter permease [Hyphomicrobiales bacterium]MBI3672129.1 ABC transporter permease [Hyphomicrobiales bacterium]
MAVIDAAASDTVMRAADGTPLKKKLRQAERREQLRALMLIAPLFLFIVVTFLFPIGSMLERAFYDSDVADNLPRTKALLANWDGKEVPGEDVFAAFAADMKAASKVKTVALIGKRLNYEIPAFKSKVVATGRKIDKVEQGPWKEAIIGIDPIWGEVGTWAVVKRSARSFTPFYLLGVLDLRQAADGSIERMPADRAIYVQILGRTFGISFLVTLCTLILGYPVAYLLATIPQRHASILMIFVLLPFWTSLLVRTTAWTILLQDGGVFSQVIHLTGITWLLNVLGLVDGEPQLFKTRFATVLAMTHIQLPFTLLPIYSVMKTISPTYMRAAKSLGGKPFYSFLRVYMPQTMSGVAAGCLLTFILSLGYYITPALVGGGTDSMIAGFIDTAMNSEANWGKASALGFMLLASTLVLYYVYNRLIGIDRMKLG